MIEQFGLSAQSQVVEVAANDGYLLQHFQKRGIPCYGIEPTESTGAVARSKGIEIVGQFFGRPLAARVAHERGQVDLLAANNVFAHVPNINDFAAGIREILSPSGVSTIEFPHLLMLLTANYFDTIYHEHFSYFSLHAAKSVLAGAGLEVFDLDEIPTHGGSLRIYAQRKDGVARPVSAGVPEFLDREVAAGLTNPQVYTKFPERVGRVKDGLLRFLLQVKSEGRSIAAYGAAAKGNTLLNYAGIRRDMLPFVVDRSPGKIGKFLPGSHIPVYEEALLKEKRPDYVFLLPWNLRNELVEQLAYVREWGGKFVVALPELEVF